MGLTDALLLNPYPFEIWIAQRADGQKGSGTLNDPYDGTTAAKLDGIMNALPGPTCVHLGPGTFETAGYRVDGAGWQIKPGMRIVGSGMDVTVEKSRVRALHSAFQLFIYRRFAGSTGAAGESEHGTCTI